MHNLVANGALLRLKKGVYTFSKNEAATGFAFRPFYYGMEYALTIRKIWTQQANPVIITRSKANPGVRRIMGSNVIVRRISPRAFFGFEYMNYSGIFVPVSKPEKTLIDFFYYGVNIDRATQNALVAASETKTLKGYARRLGMVRLGKKLLQWK